MNCCRAIVSTRLKWLAHALAHSRLVTSLMSQTQSLWTGQVVLIIMAKLMVLQPLDPKCSVWILEKTKDYCCEERCGLTAAAVCVCSSQHYYYLDNLWASANDGTGHTVKVIAYWQVNVLLITDCDASLYSYLTCWHLHLIYLFIYSVASLTLFQLFAPLYL